MLRQVMIVILFINSLNLLVEAKPIKDPARDLPEKIYSLIENSMINMLESKPEVQAGECTEINGTIIVKALTNLQKVLFKKIPLPPYSILYPGAENTLLYISEQKSSLINLTRFSAASSVNKTGKGYDISLGLLFEPISLNGDYQFDLDSFGDTIDLHIFGDGKYNFTLDGLSLTPTMSIRTISGSNKFNMTDFSFKAELNGSQITITNLLDGSTALDPIFNVIGEILPEELILGTQMFQEVVRQKVIEFVNNKIAVKFSLDDITWLLCTLAGYID